MVAEQGAEMVQGTLVLAEAMCTERDGRNATQEENGPSYDKASAPIWNGVCNVRQHDNGCEAVQERSGNAYRFIPWCITSHGFFFSMRLIFFPWQKKCFANPVAAKPFEDGLGVDRLAKILRDALDVGRMLASMIGIFNKGG